jgi:hypothetical protein
MITIKSNPSFSDRFLGYLYSQWFFPGASWWILMSLLVFTFFGWSLILIKQEYFIAFVVLAIATSCVLLLSLIWAFARASWTSLIDLLSRKPKTLELGFEGSKLTFKDDKQEQRIELSALRRVHEDGKRFFLFKNAFSAFVIRKRGLPPEDIAQIHGFIRPRMGGVPV